MNRNQIDYTIVVPVYYNEASLEQLVDDIGKHVVNARPELRGEIVFVDDGSGDDSFSVLQRIQRSNSDLVHVIKLSRNFGQVNAIWCGLEHANGRAVIVISADGQDPVELIPEMLDAHFNDGREIVAAIRAGRDESAWRKISSGISYWAIKKFSFPNMPIGGFDFFLLGRKALDVLLNYYQRHSFLQGQILRLGFDPYFLEYHRRAREHGKSRWTFHRKLTALLDGIIGYSFWPIRAISVVGFVVALLGLIYALLILLSWFIWRNPVEGWTPLMMVVLIMGGVQMAMLGVIGEYLWRTKAQVMAEPPYIIETVLQD